MPWSFARISLSCFWRSVRKCPGSTALTRMPSRATWSASVFVSPEIPARSVELTVSNSTGCLATNDVR